MPKFKNPLAAAAALADRLSEPDAARRAPRRSEPGRAGEATPERDTAGAAAWESAAAAALEREIVSMPAAPSAPTVSPSAPAAPAAPAPERGERADAPRRPYVLQEIVIPAAGEEAPPPVPFASFTEQEGEGEPGGGSAVPEAAEDAAPQTPKRRQRAPSELGSSVWAAAILLSLGCTVVAFFLGALG